MKNYFVYAIIFSVIFFGKSFPQNSFHTQSNILIFADHLFCEKDFLRAIDEYLRIENKGDSTKLKLAFSYQKINNFDASSFQFLELKNTSVADIASLNFYKNSYLAENFVSLINNFENENFISEKYFSSISKLYLTARIKANHNIDKNFDFGAFEKSEQETVSVLVKRQLNPKYKSETMAGVLSTLIPGLGKIYTQNYGDGITSLIVTGLLTYLSVNNFDHNHQFRGWLFAGLSSYFYLGNIYGSVASAQIYNANYNRVTKEEIDKFIYENNYFLPKEADWNCK